MDKPAAKGPAGQTPIPPYANAAADFFGITNVCVDPAHPYGIHRHGATRYARRAPESTQRPSGPR